MKKIFPILLILIIGCGGDEEPGRKIDRFQESLIPASEICTVERLTQDGRCIYPIFAPGDTIVYFRRLLAADNEAASGKDYKDLIKPFGLNLITMDLLNLSADYSYPPLNHADTTDFPNISGEPVTLGLRSPDSGTFAFETTEKGPSHKCKIYLRRGDMLHQLTYGDASCILEKFSHNGRYITGLLGWDPSWILIFDLENEKIYKVEHQNDLLDYMTSFSSDDSMILFIRSDGRYVLDGAPFGDIWLIKFK